MAERAFPKVGAKPPEDGASECPSATRAKLAYSTPILKFYGSVSTLTLGSSGSIGDGKIKKPSSRALKEQITRVGDHRLGFGIYLFRYRSDCRALWGDGLQLGVLAEEVREIQPGALSRGPGGEVLVDYAMLGIWPASQ